MKYSNAQMRVYLGTHISTGQPLSIAANLGSEQGRLFIPHGVRGGCGGAGGLAARVLIMFEMYLLRHF